MHKYPPLSFDELARLPMQNIADKNCALCLWATGPRQDQATALIKLWGWRFVTVLQIWEKTDKIGKPLKLPGHYAASNGEFLLLGMRGSLLVQEKMIDQKYSGPMLKPHSRKPDEIRNRIVRIFSGLPRIELFARKYPGDRLALGHILSMQGWDATGLEYDGVDIRDFLGRGGKAGTL